MFELQVEGMSFDSGLQLVQADVRLRLNGETVIDEPLCIDVGLPALLLGALEDVTPYRWAEAAQWERIPFFVCGCGDPECRGYAFTVRHRNEEEAIWAHVDEDPDDGTIREHDAYAVPLRQCREQLLELGERFLAFVAPLDYRPYFADTVPVVKQLVKRLRDAVSA